MRSLSLLVLGLALLMGWLALVPAASAQLYGDTGKDMTNGDLNNQDYWWTKFDLMMLDVAEKQHLSPGRIGFQLVATSKRLDELTKKYPKHEELKKWKARVEEVQKKIDANADRGQALPPTCPWEEANFAQLWVNLHWTKMLVDAKDWEMAGTLLTNVRDNYGIMMKPDRMQDYPDELRKWVQDAKPEIERLSKTVADKTGGSAGSAAKGPVSDVAAGDLNDADYWWTKFDLLMLDLALKEHQPEGRIDVQLAGTSKRLDELTQKYPKHAELQGWKKRVAEIQAKIDPHADRSKNFGPEVPWEEANFAQLWVNLHLAQVAQAAGDDETARGSVSNATKNYEIMMAPDRMKNYPEELRKWVQDSKADIDKLHEELKAGDHRGQRKPK